MTCLMGKIGSIRVGRVTFGGPLLEVILFHELWSPLGELFETPESVTAVCIALDRVGDVPTESD